MIAAARCGVARPIAAGFQTQHRQAAIIAGLDPEDGIGPADRLAHHGIGERPLLLCGSEGVGHGGDGILHGHQIGCEVFGDDKHDESCKRAGRRF